MVTDDMSEIGSYRAHIHVPDRRFFEGKGIEVMCKGRAKAVLDDIDGRHFGDVGGHRAVHGGMVASAGDAVTGRALTPAIRFAQSFAILAEAKMCDQRPRRGRKCAVLCLPQPLGSALKSTPKSVKGAAYEVE